LAMACVIPALPSGKLLRLSGVPMPRTNRTPDGLRRSEKSADNEVRCLASFDCLIMSFQENSLIFSFCATILGNAAHPFNLKPTCCAVSRQQQHMLSPNNGQLKSQI
jgi:hypothetical protein